MEGERDILRRGRFDGEQNRSALQFLSSKEQDRNILEADIWVDKAHTLMLHRKGIIGSEEAGPILRALSKIESEPWKDLSKGEYEDVHVLLESRIIDIVGEEAGGRLHTARSRNDEVATCIRIALRWRILETMDLLLKLVEKFVDISEKHLETVMPGYTHLQHAQPTTLAHHILSHAFALQRDITRLISCYERLNLSPLGSGAMACTTYDIDPVFSAELMAFDGVIENSMDAVSSRDHILEVLSCLSILGVNLSRLLEEIILWSSTEFGFVKLADEYSSTSSIMPQKRNPDLAELSRARISTLMGSLFSSLTICKALPQSYNRDLQEVNAHLWSATDIVKGILSLTSGLFSTLTIDERALQEAAGKGFPWATDLADFIVQNFDIPFRTAHTLVATLTKELNDQAGPSEIRRQLVNSSSKILGKEIKPGNQELQEILDPDTSIRRKRGNGPSPKSTGVMIEEIRKSQKSNLEWLEKRELAINQAKERVSSLQERLESEEA